MCVSSGRRHAFSATYFARCPCRPPSLPAGQTLALAYYSHRPLSQTPSSASALPHRTASPHRASVAGTAMTVVAVEPEVGAGVDQVSSGSSNPSSTNRNDLELARSFEHCARPSVFTGLSSTQKAKHASSPGTERPPYYRQRPRHATKAPRTRVLSFVCKHGAYGSVDVPLEERGSLRTLPRRSHVFGRPDENDMEEVWKVNAGVARLLFRGTLTM